MTAPPFEHDARQAEVLAHGPGPLLVTGPAGTGKTTVLRERFARLIEGGADPERVAIVVGSSRARDEARAALLDRLPTSLPGLQVVTIHGLANRVLRDGYASLGYAEPPQILSAAEQFAKVQELLANEESTDWPAYGALLAMRGFADEVRQFLLRAQEELRTPDEIRAGGAARGLFGWHELAGFLETYQELLDDLGVVDFAALVQRAAAAATHGASAFDHVLVDDYQDTTFGGEALLGALRPGSLLVAANPEAHVFSFQGTTPVPLERFAQTFPGAANIALDQRHRAPSAPDVRAWVAPHASEEHAGIARELRRLHVEEGVPWS